MAGDGVGSAGAGEEGFKDAITDKEAVIHGRKPDFFHGQQLAIPPDDHGGSLEGKRGKTSGRVEGRMRKMKERMTSD